MELQPLDVITGSPELPVQVLVLAVSHRPRLMLLVQLKLELVIGLLRPLEVGRNALGLRLEVNNLSGQLFSLAD
eukprot:scaffold317343_cov31-Prasinocladus_malaysianus.AAC.3